jgi:hypothetical protein
VYDAGGAADHAVTGRAVCAALAFACMLVTALASLAAVIGLTVQAGIKATKTGCTCCSG